MATNIPDRDCDLIIKGGITRVVFDPLVNHALSRSIASAGPEGLRLVQSPHSQRRPRNMAARRVPAGPTPAWAVSKPFRGSSPTAGRCVASSRVFCGLKAMLSREPAFV